VDEWEYDDTGASLSDDEDDYGFMGETQNSGMQSNFATGWAGQVQPSPLRASGVHVRIPPVQTISLGGNRPNSNNIRTPPPLPARDFSPQQPPPPLTSSITQGKGGIGPQLYQSIVGKRSGPRRNN